MQPTDPDFAERVRDSFARQGIMAHIGATLTRIEVGWCEIELPFRDELSQQHGFFHAGVVSTIADSAGGYAAFSLFPADSSVLTVEFKINLLAPADGEKMRATGDQERQDADHLRTAGLRHQGRKGKAVRARHGNLDVHAGQVRHEAGIADKCSGKSTAMRRKVRRRAGRRKQIMKITLLRRALTES